MVVFLALWNMSVRDSYTIQCAHPRSFTDQYLSFNYYVIDLCDHIVHFVFNCIILYRWSIANVSKHLLVRYFLIEMRMELISIIAAIGWPSAL